MALSSIFGRNWWDTVNYTSHIFNQHFGTGLYNDLHPPMSCRGNELRSRTLNAIQSSGESEIVNEKDKFQVNLSVVHFNPEEIEVKVVDDCIVIHGKHEERTDDHGLIQREFTRRYMLPKGAEVESVKSSLSPYGILTVEVSKKVVEVLPSIESVVPIELPTEAKTEVPEEKMEVSEEKTTS